MVLILVFAFPEGRALLLRCFLGYRCGRRSVILFPLMLALLVDRSLGSYAVGTAGGRARAMLYCIRKTVKIRYSDLSSRCPLLGLVG